MSKDKAHKLKSITKFIYGTGDFYGGASVTIIGMLFLFFLTDVVGMRPILAGTIVFLGRLVDAVTDPLMGSISDHTKSRWGRRNPYFLFFAIPVGISFSLLWLKVGFTSEVIVFAYYTLMYAIFCVVFTAVMVPYAALAPELTPDYNDRTSLVSTRMAFSIVGALAAAVVPKTIIDANTDPAKGYIIMAVAFSCLFMAIWFGMFTHMRSKESFTGKPQAQNFFKALFSTFKNKAFLPLIGIYLFSFIPTDIMSTNFIYYLTYHIEKPSLFTTIMGTMLICTALSMLIYVPLVKKLGKRKTYLMGATYWAVVLSALFFMNAGTPVPFIVGYALFLGLGMGVSYAIPWSMLPEVIDVDEVITDQRREGLYSGVMTFLRKLSSSLAMLGISTILELSGYIASKGGEMAAQPASAITAIRLTIAIAPIVCLAFALFCAYRFPITKANFGFVRRYLDHKNTGTAIPDDDKPSYEHHLSTITGKDITL